MSGPRDGPRFRVPQSHWRQDLAIAAVMITVHRSVQQIFRKLGGGADRAASPTQAVVRNGALLAQSALSTRACGHPPSRCCPSDPCPASTPRRRSRATAHPRHAGSRQMDQGRSRATSMRRLAARCRSHAARATENWIGCTQWVQSFRCCRTTCVVSAERLRAHQTQRTHEVPHRQSQPRAGRRLRGRSGRAR